MLGCRGMHAEQAGTLDGRQPGMGTSPLEGGQPPFPCTGKILGTGLHEMGGGGYNWQALVNGSKWPLASQDEPSCSVPTHAGKGSAGKAPWLPSHGEELRTSVPVGPQFYSTNCPQALVKASQPTNHWHVISYHQTGQHLSLVEGGSQASSAPLPPRNTHPTKTTRSHFPSEGGRDLPPVIELGTPDLHPRIRSPHAEDGHPPAEAQPPAFRSTAQPEGPKQDPMHSTQLPITVASGTDGIDKCVAHGPARAEREACVQVFSDRIYREQREEAQPSFPP